MPPISKLGLTIEARGRREDEPMSLLCSLIRTLGAFPGEAKDAAEDGRQEAKTRVVQVI